MTAAMVGFAFGVRALGTSMEQTAPTMPPTTPPSTPAPAPPATTPPAQPDTKPATPRGERGVDPKWLEKLSKEDRAALDEVLGYAPPPFTPDVKWIGGDPTNWDRLRGKVVVVQSWTTGTTGGRGWPTRVAIALKEMKPEDMQIIALHTPEKAEGAEDFMKRQKPPESVAVVIDPVGAFCDSLGIYKHPVNLIIDRNGFVRYAGLNLNGVKEAVAELVAQPFDAKAVPAVRPVEKPAEAPTAPKYPPTSTKVTGANDLRGKPAPDFGCDQWFTKEVSLTGRPVIITFWSKDDAKTLPSHGHLNALADQFGQRVASAMICEDGKSSFEESILRRNVDKNDFHYGVALDRKRRMAGPLNVTETPHSIVMSKDWIVRWQGRTSDLKSQIIQQILDADATASPPPMGTPTSPMRRGWVQN